MLNSVFVSFDEDSFAGLENMHPSSSEEEGESWTEKKVVHETLELEVKSQQVAENKDIQTIVSDGNKFQQNYFITDAESNLQATGHLPLKQNKLFRIVP